VLNFQSAFIRYNNIRYQANLITDLIYPASGGYILFFKRMYSTLFFTLNFYSTGVSDANTEV